MPAAVAAAASALVATSSLPATPAAAADAGEDGGDAAGADDIGCRLTLVEDVNTPVGTSAAPVRLIAGGHHLVLLEGVVRVGQLLRLHVVDGDVVPPGSRAADAGARAGPLPHGDDLYDDDDQDLDAVRTTDDTPVGTTAHE